MEKVNIFLDDYRPPLRNFEVARDYNDFIRLVNQNKNNIGIISFDYDLDSVKTGLDAAKYIIENNIVVEKLRIHSSHSNRKKIYELLKENYPNVEIEVLYKL